MARYPRMDYNPEIADEICVLIAEGCTIRDICAREGMPNMKIFFRWLRENEETFGVQYARAKEEQAENMVTEMLQIADDARNDWMEKETKNGTIRVVDHEIDTRKWLASKLKPKKYGDRIIHAGDEQAPLVSKNVSGEEKVAFDRFVQTYKALPEKEEEEEELPVLEHEPEPVTIDDFSDMV